MLKRLSLDGKTIVITGGGTGLGREMALAMTRGRGLILLSRLGEQAPSKRWRPW